MCLALVCTHSLICRHSLSHTPSLSYAVIHCHMPSCRRGVCKGEQRAVGLRPLHEIRHHRKYRIYAKHMSANCHANIAHYFQRGEGGHTAPSVQSGGRKRPVKQIDGGRRRCGITSTHKKRMLKSLLGGNARLPVIIEHSVHKIQGYKVSAVSCCMHPPVKLSSAPNGLAEGIISERGRLGKSGSA